MTCLCGGCAACLTAQGLGPREGDAEVDFIDTSDAEDEACRNARSWANFFDGSIAPDESYPFQYATTACSIDFDAKPTGLLLVLAMDLGQTQETRLAALYELRERFLKEVADDIEARAQRLANERYDETVADLLGATA